jgi:hypothetical protein
MRAIPLIMLLTTTTWAADPFGTWKMNPTRSTFIGDPHPRAVTVRIERHAKGEVFTFDRIRGDGQAVTTSTILYLDGKEREFQGEACSGTQASRRIDRQTVEIIYKCQDRLIRFTRLSPPVPSELIFDITEQFTDGRRFERHLVLEKQ